MNSDQELCIYCGEKPKETNDHVPPKSFYPKPRPSNLITVPSCLECNQSAGKDEEFFLATFMFSNAGISEAGKQLWSEKLHRMYTKNIGLKRKIADALEPTELITPAGLYLGKRWAINTDEARFENVVNKIIRGLYYNEYQSMLPQESEIISIYLTKLEHFDAVKEYSNQLKQGSKGWKGIFEYKFNRLTKSPAESMWLILFYNFAIFWAITGNERNKGS